MTHTRRSFLRTTGGVLGAVIGFAGSVGASDRATASHSDHRWHSVTTPTERNLADVIHAGDHAYAVGGGGTVLERRDAEWRTILDAGPTGNGNNLAGVDATADGEHVWFVGASGSVGRYDVGSGGVTSRSAPGGVTNAFTDVAVTGEAGDANVYITDASGKVHVSFANGADGSWSHYTPGSGSAIRSIDFYDARQGVLVDGNQAVFETADGTTWSRIGLDDANHGLTAVDADSEQTIRLAGGGGAVYERVSAGWNVETPVGTALQDVNVAPCGCVFAVGGGGLILHYRPSHGMGGMDGASSERMHPAGWHVSPTPTGENLAAISLRRPHITVGASGTILER